MDRRYASKLILTGSFAAPALIHPKTTWSNPLDEKEEEARLAETARPVIRHAARNVVLKWFLINTGSDWIGMNLARDFRQYNEKRSSLGGLLRGYQRPTVSQRMKLAELVGTIYLVNSSLVMLPDTQLNFKQMEYNLYHQYLSWDLEAALKIVQLGDRTPEDIRKEAKQIGAAYALAGTLIMLMINPVTGRMFNAGS